MWNIQRMSFYAENLHLYNNFFVRVQSTSPTQFSSTDSNMKMTFSQKWNVLIEPPITAHHNNLVINTAF